MNGDETREKGGGERGARNLRSDYRRGSEDDRVGPTPTSNQQSQSQDPTPPQDRHIIRRIRVQRWEARNMIGNGGREAKKHKKPQKRYGRDVGNGGESGEWRKKRRQESIGSVDIDPKDLNIDPEDLENRKEAEREKREVRRA